ncbi:hypothetical protein [Salinicoccus albus]|uniref:hypothetical protein n=1 Tax=Salinicoccus albus TaxID=418756 RepID=UPI00037438C9|nr:hypothetical protein [Salinicoccus albus]
MLKFFCTLIPSMIIILMFALDFSFVWVLNILLSMLGTLFSSVNFKLRKNAFSTILLIVNTGLFIYYLVSVIMFFS